ncbi:hypothetical protein LUX33_10455 [Actinomadura madurae]|uniref:hypothetical protein n=1 Tax=Actinomadura madurae TaxID=1993 RepID=UPI0020D20040|nr:hypothetical protein [Actinomadura madurae]MCP9948793.1 hypothetical protein [Actinomadura madurae]
MTPTPAAWMTRAAVSTATRRRPARATASIRPSRMASASFAAAGVRDVPYISV